jgi:hypothetical protein
MPKRTSKKEDSFQAAARVVALTTGEPLPQNILTAEQERMMRSNAASILGKLGGSKGGKARAANLTAKKRQQIAKKAAKARWSKKP